MLIKCGKLTTTFYKYTEVEQGKALCNYGAFLLITEHQFYSEKVYPGVDCNGVLFKVL